LQSGAWNHTSDADRACRTDAETDPGTCLMSTVSTDGKTATKRAMIALVISGVLTVLLFAAAPDNLYEWIKALHIIAVIAWMAGMLYLPRLFVYHADAQMGSSESETFKVMERKLLRLIINPAMIATWVLGLWL